MAVSVTLSATLSAEAQAGKCITAIQPIQRKPLHLYKPGVVGSSQRDADISDMTVSKNERHK